MLPMKISSMHTPVTLILSLKAECMLKDGPSLWSLTWTENSEKLTASLA